MFNTVHIAGKPWIVGQTDIAQDVFTQFAPFPITLNGNQNLFAVLCFKHPIRRD